MLRAVFVAVAAIVLLLVSALVGRSLLGPSDVDRDASVTANLALLEQLPEVPGAVRLHIRHEPFWLDMGALQGSYVAAYGTSTTYRAPRGFTRPEVVLFYRDALQRAGWRCQTAGSGAGDCRRGEASLGVDMYDWTKARPVFTVHVGMEPGDAGTG